MESKPLLNLGLKKEFGNGSDIDILRDPWIIDVYPRGAVPRSPSSVPSLHQLVDLHSDQWNLDNLSLFFEPAECQRNMQNKPGGADSLSRFSWIHNNSGVYSVKSGYWLWSSSHLNQSLATEQKPNLNEIFKKVWKLNSSSKILNFIWRCLTFSLSVGHELRKKHITADASCRLCGHEKEDVNHLLFQCDLAQEVWTSPSLITLFPDGVSDSLYDNVWNCLLATDRRSDAGVEDVNIGPWILWLIWKGRNEFVFQGKTTSGTRILQKASVDAKEWIQHNTSPAVSLSTAHSTQMIKWTAPPTSYLKCNIDAAWQDSHDRCGVSWILRNSDGAVRLYGVKVYPRLLSPLEAEATALVWAMNCMWNMGYDKIIFESDSSNLIDAVKSPLSWPRLASFTTEIQGIASRRPWNITFAHISRKRNEAADVLAKYALNFPMYFGSIDNSIPSWLQPSLDC